MKVTVCEMPDERKVFADAWQALAAHARREDSELILLPEMPFCSWFADSRNFDAKVWQAAVKAHDEWGHRLRELAPAVVAATRPIDFGNQRYNAGFVWDAELGDRAVHAKAFLPDEEGVWEASWYHRAAPEFQPLELEIAAAEVNLGFLICTELWAMDEARLYGQEGVHALLTPRATAAMTFDKWLAGGRVAAIVAGAYSLSANRVDASGAFGGQSWIIDPDGNVLGLTDREHPFVTMDLDLTVAEAAKTSFPRYAIARSERRMQAKNFGTLP
jgi:N-carbamoylputrescine amidase